MKSFTSKLVTVCMVGLLLLVAGFTLRMVVNDRLENRNQARASIAQSLGAEQTLAGVTLAISYTERYQEVVVDPNTSATRVVPRKIAHRYEVMPEHFDLKGQLITDPRYRGLFRVNGYQLEGLLSGDFAIPALERLPRDRSESQIELGPAWMVLAVSDPRGLRKLDMKLADVARDPESGVGNGSNRHGASARLDDINALLGRTTRFSVNLELVGTDSLNVIPLGRDNSATLTSPWPHPSFGGRFLPSERKVDQHGFSATWHISALATNARESWGNKAATAEIDNFNISLIDPVDIYVMADRACKYAGLFIAITLGGFLLFELLRSLRLHALQYLMIGAALLIFFLLLLSLSEHIGFGGAYLAASSACVLLIGIYSVHLLRSLWLAGAFSLGLGSLYAVLYVILLSEQNALLMGSLLLFLLLAAVMLSTRSVDWHTLLAERPAREQEDSSST
jgi:inner membrane protein